MIDLRHKRYRDGAVPLRSVRLLWERRSIVGAVLGAALRYTKTKMFHRKNTITPGAMNRHFDIKGWQITHFESVTIKLGKSIKNVKQDFPKTIIIRYHCLLFWEIWRCLNKKLSSIAKNYWNKNKSSFY